MPRLTDSMEEGSISSWLKSVGDSVVRGEPLVEIETDKATMECESQYDGVLLEVIAQDGATVAVGQVIARVGRPGETAGISSDDQTVDAPTRTSPAKSESVRATVKSPKRGRHDRRERVDASPVARSMARERGISLAELQGTGPGGRIVSADVERAAQSFADAEKMVADAGAPEPSNVSERATGTPRIVHLTRVQLTVARRMVESKTTIPHFHLSGDVDMTEAIELRRTLREEAGSEGATPSFNDLVIRCCALALRDHPRVNSAFADDAVELYPRINIGVAVAAPDGLIVPTIFDADRKSLTEISRISSALAGKVRDGSITPPEIAGGTFTVSNLGMYGVDEFQAVINPGQAALLAVGAITRRPVVEHDGTLAVRSVMTVNLACDHRVLDGAEGGAFLTRVRRLLERPLLMSV